MLFWDHDNRVYIYSTSVCVCVGVTVCAPTCIAQPALSLVQPDMEAAIWRASLSDIKRASALILHSISFQALSLYLSIYSDTSCIIVLPENGLNLGL